MDTLKTIWEDFNDRFKSPFVVSFIISWCLWNWWILYSVCNFDTGSTLDFRLAYISNYISANICKLSIYPLATSFVAAIIFYLAKSVFLGLDSFYENRLRLKVIKGLGIEEMVPTSDLERLKKEVDLKQKALMEKDNLYQNSQSEIAELQNRLLLLSDSDRTIEHQTKEINDLKVLYGESQKKQSELSKELQIPETLENFFKGTWICEYNLIKESSPFLPYIGYDKFFLKKEEYHIEGKLNFVISNIRYVPALDSITFHKVKLESRDFVNRVTITKVNESLWSGIEYTADGFISYLRFYPIDKKPSHFPLVLPREAVVKHDLVDLYMKSFEYICNAK